MTVKLYKVTCTKGYRMDEQGETYSLEPWGNNTPYYDGYDDGGKSYMLPENFEVAKGKDELNHIYTSTGKHVPVIMHSSGMPQLCIDLHNMPVLKFA